MNITDKLKADIKALSTQRNFYFFIDENGLPTPDEYGSSGKNPELYIEQRPNDPSLTKVYIEGMSDVHPHLKPALEFLIELDPILEQAELRLDNNPRITLNEFLKSKAEQSNTLPKYLYHGTSLDKVEDILKNGLQPRSLTNVAPQYMSETSGESDSSMVYLCTKGNIGSAKFAARQAASKNKSQSVILKIETKDLNLKHLNPDEDSKSNTWMDSIQKMGNVAYKGIIDANKISIDNKLSNNLNDVSSFLEKYNKKKEIKRPKLN